MSDAKRNMARSAYFGEIAPRDGFTLIEVLIVVVLLGIIAAVVIPQFSNATSLARENTLKDELRYLRMQITVYRAQHRDVPPGHPNGNVSQDGTHEDFRAQMTQFTDEWGNVNAERTEQYRFGPYLQKIPMNPLTGLTQVLVVPNSNGGMYSAPQDTDQYGWIYCPVTQDIRANVEGADDGGLAYFNY